MLLLQLCVLSLQLPIFLLELIMLLHAMPKLIKILSQRTLLSVCSVKGLLQRMPFNVRSRHLLLVFLRLVGAQLLNLLHGLPVLISL